MPGTLTPWDSFAELGDLRCRFDHMFDGWLDGREHPRTSAIDVVREDGHVVVRPELPEINPEAVKTEIDDDILTISGECEERAEHKEEDYDRRWWSFLRSMALPVDVDAEQIKASTRDGVVEVTVPLPKEASREPVRIAPTVAS
jgi:HSP20 family protein